VHVIGTTGFNVGEERKIKAAARHATIIKSGNMSLGVNALLGTVKNLAKSLDSDWDIEISDMHHKDKVDSPSGTALELASAAAKGREIDLDSSLDISRMDRNYQERKAILVSFLLEAEQLLVITLSFLQGKVNV
jgi:4-hydroxy-tetrahydrodipicolinate reductase